MTKKVIVLNCTIIGGGGGKVMIDIAKVARNNNYEYYTSSPEANVIAPKLQRSTSHLVLHSA